MNNEDWKDRYYEQQALHTEARGMLCQERDAMQRRAEAAEADMKALELEVATWKRRYNEIGQRIPGFEPAN